MTDQDVPVAGALSGVLSMWAWVDPENERVLVRNDRTDLVRGLGALGGTVCVSTRCCVLVIPGFGVPHIRKKQEWLYMNVYKIRQSLPSSWWLYIIVSCYSGDAASHVFCLGHLPRYPKTRWIIRFVPDILGRFLRTQLDPSCLRSFCGTASIAMVMILLDDVEIVGEFDADRAHRTLLQEDLHILSPTLDRRSVSCHKFMFRLWSTAASTFRRTNYAELFFYIMTFRGYTRWHALLDPDTRFLWGIDMILFPMGVRIGVSEELMVRHHISSKLEKSPFYHQMQQELRSYSRRYPQNIAFRFKNLWVHTISKTGERRLLTDRVAINPRFERLERIVCGDASTPITTQ